MVPIVGGIHYSPDMSPPHHTTLFLLVLLSTTGLLAGQTTYVVSPPGFSTKTGGTQSWGIAAYANGRSQLADGNFRNQTMTLKGISFRLPSPTTGYWNPGRSFTNVTLRMSETLIPKMSGVFSSNVLITPTLVSQGKVTLPFVTGPSPSVPAPWSVHFPFTTSWLYTGKLDILADFEFFGGKLSNNQAWSTNPDAYPLDAAAGTKYAYGLPTDLGNVGAAGCVDSGSNVATLSGRALLTVVSYTRNDPFNPLAGQLVISQGGNSFGANTKAVMAFGFLPSTAGVPFPGVTCNRIHVGLGGPLFFSLSTTDFIGRVPTHYPITGANGLPMLSLYAGIPIVVQGAWHDTKKGNLLLSSASTAKIPAMPTLHNLAAVHGATKTSGNPSIDAAFNHVRRYTR